ncbi:iron ABC transporter permease [Cytophagales bacterium LB-30]|uniref:Iron ABC transporter permease n=1 Tax=Shiella aurantiaca TaxID=3058365 RepID=A0ABT8F8M2_9BACT|nr:iron ABC transporter permease [Shiella aurantiaca]MDN4166296.1 iron ABC transporter permease [Shiella aurantiaca]
MVLLILSVVLSISVGSVLIPFGDIVAYLFGSKDNHPLFATIIGKFRLPKTLAALTAGAGLSLSGLLMQSYFRNPLAGPYVLGISSGASLGVALLTLAGINLAAFTGLGHAWSIALSAALGSLAVFMVIMYASLRIHNHVMLLILGIMFGSATSALVSIMQYFSQADSLQRFLFWSFGNLGGLTWQELQVMLPLVGIGILLSLWALKDLQAMSLGETYAASMGVPLKKLRWLIVLSTSIMAGVITAFCGPIAFVGIGVPHLARLLFRTANQQVLFPGSLLLGMIILLLCDSIAQVPGSDYTLPINIITSLLGAPLVISMLLKNRNVKSMLS